MDCLEIFSGIGSVNRSINMKWDYQCKHWEKIEELAYIVYMVKSSIRKRVEYSKAAVMILPWEQFENGAHWNDLQHSSASTWNWLPHFAYNFNVQFHLIKIRWFHWLSNIQLISRIVPSSEILCYCFRKNDKHHFTAAEEPKLK